MAERSREMIAYIRALLNPLDTLYYAWYLFRTENIYKLEHTGQVCYLRKSLNDKFDPSQRRIYIGNGLLYDTLYIHTEAEAQRQDLHTEAEDGTLWLRTEAETADTGLDFIVYVPQEVYSNSLYAVKGHIEFYLEGGARYSIMIIN
ncbi:hypothetical protein R1T16_17535 [Flavobacterium sp. DG1-102-2]|uniref:hypothetical protein n=1 Tax=Flavobacterium sp. DG1-102-2 TaxID=3081663 RepID=UPI0029498A9C|nr:hypothetical protein [Flavobacterium sp. DG1-102-2]MDV6170243.1 hypothetical protein [Flavobacterium sp. DG1-102-2]